MSSKNQCNPDNPLADDIVSW